MKTSTKYHFKGMLNAIKIYYAILALIYVVLSVIELFGQDVQVMYGTGRVSFIGFSTVIFLFVAGLNSFKQNFYMLSQNGRSRMETAVSFGISMSITAVAMSIIDALAALGISYIIAPDIITSLDPISVLWMNILWGFIAYLQAGIVGYFITIAYYRMNVLLKVFVSIGVPAFLIFVIPIVDRALFSGKIGHGTTEYFYRLFGETGIDQPLLYLLGGLCFSAIIFICSLLLVRRAEFKS